MSLNRCSGDREAGKQKSQTQAQRARASAVPVTSSVAPSREQMWELTELGVQGSLSGIVKDLECQAKACLRVQQQHLPTFLWVGAVLPGGKDSLHVTSAGPGPARAMGARGAAGSAVCPGSFSSQSESSFFIP